MFPRILIVMFLILSFSGSRASGATISQDFESGNLPADWTMTSSTIKKDNNSNRLAMSGGGTLTLPSLTGATSVAFSHRGSGNGKVLTVDVSTDGGSTWSRIGEATVSSSSSYGRSSFATGTPADASVTIRFTAQSGTIYLDDIEVNYVSLAEEPTVACAIAETDVTGTAVEITLMAGNGSGRIVAIAEGETMTWSPADGTAWSGQFPKHVGENVMIVASGNQEKVIASGLRPATVYTIAAWEYAGEGESVNYLTSSPAKVTVTTLRVPVFTVSPSSLNFHNVASGGEKCMDFTLQGNDLESGDDITLSLSGSGAEAYALSADGGATWGERCTVAMPADKTSLDGMKVSVKFNPAEKREYQAAVSITGGGAEAEVTLRGNGSERDSRVYYISPDGDDTGGDGSFESPWMNLQPVVNMAQPGDIIYCRGGRYHFTTRDSSGKLTVRLKNSGTAEAPITITAWADEHPIFDFEQQLIDCNGDRSKVGDRGMLITGNYWTLYGLHITHAADNGIKLEGSHCRIERCEFSYCLDSGLQLGFGHDFSASGFGSKNDGSYCAYNDIIDCDSHHNCDYDTNYGSDADGFACKMHNGKGNRFIRCRAWRNGDDAWDLFETDYSVMLIECWAWESGKASDHEWVYEYFPKGLNFSGNGNGIKLGGNGTGGSSKGVHYAYNCIAWGNNKTSSVKGFDCNNHKDGHVIVGGLAWDNGYDYMFDSGCSPSSEFYNNVCLGRQEIAIGTESNNALGSQAPKEGKTWINGVLTGISHSDFVSLDEADALAPRGEDGSLPKRFARLRSGSRLVDAGVLKPVPYADEFPYLQQPVYGLGRDIGPYELEEGEVQSQLQMIMSAATTDGFTLSPSGRGAEIIATVTLGDSQSTHPEALEAVIYSMSGRETGRVYLGEFEPGIVYSVPVRLPELSPGIYMVRVIIHGTPYVTKIRI